MADRYRLKLKGLRFISAVDTPAQETAKVRLVKRKGALAVDGDFRVAKLNDELGIVFGYAFTSTNKGAEYYDLQGDNVLSDDDMVKAALAFVEGGAMSDEMHDRAQTGTVPFVMPMTPDIAKAFGIEGGEYGLMVGVRPAADVFAKFKTGELTGFSIDGMGEREPVGKPATFDIQVSVDPSDGGATAKAAIDAALRDQGAAGATAGQQTELFGLSTAAAKARTEENDMSDALKTEIEALKAERIKFQADLAKANALANLTDAEKAFRVSLPASEQDAWLEKSASDRGADIRKAAEADAVVYTAADGVEYRKSHDPTLVAAVKRADEAVAKTEAAEKRAQDVELRKRADDEIGKLGGKIDVRANLLKAVESIADEEARKAVTDLLKDADKQLAKMYETVGTFEREPSAAGTEWESLVTKRMNDTGESRGAATVELTKTPEGRAAYEARRTVSN